MAKSTDLARERRTLVDRRKKNDGRDDIVTLPWQVVTYERFSGSEAHGITGLEPTDMTPSGTIGETVSSEKQITAIDGETSDRLFSLYGTGGDVNWPQSS